MPEPKDFTKSAVNLCDPPQIGEKLKELHKCQATLAELDALLIENETYKALKAEGKLIADITAQIKDMVDALGSWQNLEEETYAIKYARTTKLYNLEPFKHHFPKFVELCVKESIDVTALEGQVKGKLITIEELERHHVLTYDTSYAFYVR